MVLDSFVACTGARRRGGGTELLRADVLTIESLNVACRTEINVAS